MNNSIIRKIFDNPEDYQTVSDWSNVGLLEGLSMYHKKLLSNYFYRLIKINSKLINPNLEPYYLVCLRRVFKVIVDSGDLDYILYNRNLDEIELDLNDFIDYINTYLPRTLIGLNHLENELDYEAEALATVSLAYINRMRNIYRDNNLLTNHLTKIKRDNKIDSIIKVDLQ